MMEKEEGTGANAFDPAQAAQRLRRTLDLKPERPASARGLYDAEARVKMYEQMKHRMWRRKLLKNIFEVCVLLGLLCSFWFIYKGVDAHLQHKRELAAAERAAEEAREAERERRQAEEREKIRAEQEARRAAEKAARDAAVAERERLAKEKTETIEAYKVFIHALRENEFDIFGKSVTNTLAETGGELCYFLPLEERNITLYWATYATNAAPQVVKIDEYGNREPIDFDTFSKRIAPLDYLVAKEGKTYYHPRRKKPLWGTLSKTEPCDPSDKFFAGLAKSLADNLRPSFDDLVYDIVFIPAGMPNKRIVCETLEFGCKYSLDNMREAIEKEFPPKSYGGETMKIKKFKRTVKFWNGSMIKHGIDGITYVPRHDPSARGYVHSSIHSLSGYNTVYRRTARRLDDSQRWAELYSQAQREESEEAAYYARERSEYEARRKKGKDAALTQYEERINGIIQKGELYYHAKKRK